MATAVIGERTETIAAEEYGRYQPKLEAVIERLNRRLSSEDIEEIASECWLDLHKRRARRDGEEYESPWKFLCIAAERRVIDRVRRSANPARAAEPSDPAGRLIGQLASGGDGPEETVESALDERELADLLSELTPRQQGIVKRMYLLGLSAAETREAMGLNPKQHDKAHAAALLNLARKLHASGHPMWAEGKVALMARLVAGSANERQLAQARNLARLDDEFGVALASYRSTLHALGAAIPLDVVLREDLGDGVLERFFAGIDGARDTISSFLSGGDGGVEAAGSAATGAGAAGTGGVLAATGTKAIIGLCAGAAATACVAAVVVPVSLDGPGDNEEKSAGPSVERVERPNRRADVARLAALSRNDVPETSESVVAEPSPPPPRQPRSAQDDQQAAPPSPASPTSPSDPRGFNPYDPTETQEAGPAAPSTTSSSTSSSSDGEGSSGGCNPYDTTC